MTIKSSERYNFAWSTVPQASTVTNLLNAMRALDVLLPPVDRVRCTVEGYPAQIEADTLAQLSEDLAAVPEGQEFFGASIDFQGPETKRVLVRIVFQNGAISGFLVQPDQALRTQLRESLEEYFPRLGALTSEPRSVQDSRTVDCYRLIRRLGRGYSGEVWEAEVIYSPPGVSLRPGQHVAIKLYHADLIRRRAESVRIQREFHVASSIRSRHLVRVHDVLVSPSRGQSFLVMDFIAGRVLKDAIPPGGLSSETVLEYGLQLFSALDEIHSLGAIHRDVKAANVMLCTEKGGPDRLVLLDLGIVLIEEDATLTGTSAFLGSKHTASLEQLRGQDLDHRTDIYSAGALLFQCYTGRPLYHRAGPLGEIVFRMLSAPERAAARDSRDNFIVAFINACIDNDVSVRPATARECIEMLKAAPTGASV